jgi:hypothetical protein
VGDVNTERSTIERNGKIAQCEACGNEYENALRTTTRLCFLIAVAADGEEEVRLDVRSLRCSADEPVETTPCREVQGT